MGNGPRRLIGTALFCDQLESERLGPEAGVLTPAAQLFLKDRQDMLPQALVWGGASGSIAWAQARMGERARTPIAQRFTTAMRP